MAVNLSPYGGVGAQFFSNNGVPLAGGKIFTYSAGTTTPQATYTSASGSTAHANPIILDAAGRVPGGEIWLTDGLQYKFVLKDANDITLATYDNVVGINSNFVNYTNQQEIQTATAGQTVFTLTTMQYAPGTDSLSVFVDGVNQYGPGAQYAFLETNATTVTFVSGLHVGASVKFTTSQITSSSAGSASQISFTGFNGQVGNVQDLAGNDGSDWIGFEASGANAVARSAQEKMRDVVSVKDFGATGDGSTDDSNAIIAAQTSLGANGGMLYFPAGTYMVGKTIPFKTGVHYLGESAKSSIVKATAASWDNIFGEGYPTTNPSQYFLENLTIDGNKAARSENQLALLGTVSGTFVDGETVTSSGGGTAVVAAHDIAGTFITLNPSSIVGAFNVGNTVTGSSSGATMTIASKQADDAYQISVRCQSAASIRITNCRFINSFFTALSLYNNCVESTVENCEFYDNNKSGTLLSSPYTIYIESYGRNLTVSNNIIDNSLGSGIVVRGGTLSAIQIVNNKISNTGNYGIEVQSAVQGGNGVASDINIIGNRLYAAPNGAADQITVIGAASPAVLSGINIVGNVCDTGQYGIGVRENVDTFSIVGNSFRNVTTAPYGAYAGGAGTPSQYTFVANSVDVLPSGFYNSATINGISWIVGSNTPEGAVYAPVGSFYSRTNGGTGTSFYVKETGGSTNFGWVAK